MWWPAQTPKSPFLRKIRRFCFVVACPNLKISARYGDFALWWPAQTPKSSYLGEIRRFCFVVACPNPKIVLSRRDKAIFALWWPAQTPKSSYLGEIRRFCPNSSYLGEIRRFCFVVACPNPKIVLSRRDKAILLCGGLPKPQNRPISARYDDFALWWPAQTPKSSYLSEIRRFCFVVACPNPKIALSPQDKAILLCGGLPKPQNRPISTR